MTIKASLRAMPRNYVGPAPAVSRFEGSIEVTGLTADGNVKYHFTRSDGGVDQNLHSISVKKPGGVFPVATTWSLSSSQYAGWQAVEVTEPVKVVSNQAPFSVRCWHPDLAVNTFKVELNSPQQWVKFAAVVTNLGDSDVTGPFKVIIGAGIQGWVDVQTTVDIPASVVIPKGGSWVTPYAAEQQLWHNRAYWVDILIDPNRQLKEMNRANDRLKATWVSPAA